MSEKEIRLILREVIADLDQRAIRTLKKVLLPSMLGASLALGAGASSGCNQRTLPQQSQSDSTTITADGSVPPPDSSSLPDGAPPDGARRPAPDSEPAVDTRPPDPPPEPTYMAPMYGVPFPEPDGGM